MLYRGETKNRVSEGSKQPSLKSEVSKSRRHSPADVILATHKKGGHSKDLSASKGFPRKAKAGSESNFAGGINRGRPRGDELMGEWKPRTAHKRGGRAGGMEAHHMIERLIGAIEKMGPYYHDDGKSAHKKGGRIKKAAGGVGKVRKDQY